jgi:hypothetical protein
VRQYSGLDISTVPGVPKINQVLRSLNNMLKLNQACISGTVFCVAGHHGYNLGPVERNEILMSTADCW